MKSHPLLPICRAILLLVALPSITHAQEAPIPRGCTATPAQLEAEKKIALEFYRPGITPQERIALIDPSYIQHNPLAVKAAAENHLSAYEEFKQLQRLFAGPPAPAGTTGSGGPAKPEHAGPQPVIVMAECDLVTVVLKARIQDPTAAPGTKYDAFAWDTFRIRGSKIVEHWDGVLITVKAMHMVQALQNPASAPAAATPATPQPAGQK